MRADAADNAGVAAPLVVVSIDTEEERPRSDAFRAIGNSCRNVDELPRLDAVFRRLGVRPTYLVAWAVAADEHARSILRELADGGRAEIGAHLHPWCTPPLLPGGTRARATFPHRLRREVQRLKIAVLRRAITGGLGVTPTSYRAGRWGFDRSTVPILEELGFTVDASVKPLWWDDRSGGASFIAAPQVPYRLDADDAGRPGRSGIVEVPVSAAIVGRRGSLWEHAARLLPPLPGLHRVVHGVGWRALLPEVHALDELRALADELGARRAPLFHVSFRSSALLAGATRYVRDDIEVRCFVARVEALLEHLRGRHHARPATLSEVPARLGRVLLHA